MATRDSSHNLDLGSDGCDLECDVCKYRKIRSEAVAYCIKCTEALCVVCKNVHGASEYTRSHKVLTGDQLKMVSSSAIRIPSIMTCEHHQLLITHMCKEHEDFFCDTCKITSHRACKTTVIEELASKERPSQMFKKVRRQLAELEATYAELKTKRIEDKRYLKTNITCCLDDVDKLRKEVNQFLDSLEGKLKSEIQEVERKISKELDEHLVIADDTLVRIRENIKLLQKCEQTQQDAVVFVGVKNAEKVIQGFEETAREIGEDVNDVMVELKPDELFKTTLYQSESLGSIRVRESNPIDLFSLDQSKTEKLLHDLGDISVRSITFLPSGHVVLACAENGLKLLDHELRLKSELPTRAFAACLVGKKEVLVTLGKEAKLKFVEVLPEMVVRSTIDVGKVCSGVDFHDGEIYVTCHDNPGYGEVRVLDKAGIIRRRFGFDGTQYRFVIPSYVKVVAGGERIIVVDQSSHSVTCLDRHGDEVYTYKDSYLRAPWGACVDGDGNLLVCGQLSRNVHRVLKDGTKQGVVLAQSDGIQQPLCVSYRKSDGLWAVGMHCQEGGSLFTFKTNTR